MHDLKKQGEFVASALKDICAGNHLLEQKEFQKAKKSYMKGMKKYKHLSKRESYYLEDLARVYRKIGMLFLVKENDPKAFKLYNKACNTLIKAKQKFPDNEEVLKKLAYTDFHICHICKRLGRLNDIKRIKDKALDAFYKLNEFEPNKYSEEIEKLQKL